MSARVCVRASDIYCWPAATHKELDSNSSKNHGKYCERNDTKPLHSSQDTYTDCRVLSISPAYLFIRRHASLTRLKLYGQESVGMIVYEGDFA